MLEISHPGDVNRDGYINAADRGVTVKKALKYIALVIAAFTIIFSAFVVLPIVADRISFARSSAYWEARRSQDYERNLYLMAQLPDYFAGSYYRPSWYYAPGHLVILVVEGGYAAARELWPSRETHIRENVARREVGGWRPVEFTYARLLETKAAVMAAMEARPGCVYVDNIRGPYILIADNRILMETTNLIQMDYQDVWDGFRQYVFDSEMIEFERVFYFSLMPGPRYGVVAVMSLMLAAIVAFAILMLLEWRKARRGQNMACREGETEC